MRVMLDANVLLSAFVFKSKKLNELIERVSKEHEVLISSYTLKEIQEVIEKKFQNIDIREIDNFFKTFPFKLVYSPKSIETKLFEIRDEDDYIVLHTAIIENIDVFISGDKDFEDVKIDKPQIMKPSEFLNRYYNQN